MISICIPVYNFEVTELVSSLVRQIDRMQDPKPEILIGDDGSEDRFLVQYESLRELPFVTVLRASPNNGRSKIRNWIAEHAKFDYLLFIDGDCLVKSEAYLNNYQSEVNRKKKVVIGGIFYSETLHNPRHALRWQYGHQRESKINYLQQEMSFLSSNFLVEKSTFERFRFDESFEAYGHEDSLLGLTLRNAGTPITQIDNPVLHMGLEAGQSFIEKTKSSLENLKLLSAKTEGIKIRKKSLLLRVQETKLNPVFLLVASKIYRATHKLMLNNLLGQKPSLFVFDLYKLFYLLHLKHLESRK